MRVQAPDKPPINKAKVHVIIKMIMRFWFSHYTCVQSLRIGNSDINFSKSRQYRFGTNFGHFQAFSNLLRSRQKSRQIVPVYCWYTFSALWNIKHFHLSCCFYDFTADFSSVVTAPINGQWWPNYWAVEGAAQFNGKPVIEIFKKICCYPGRDRKSLQFFIHCLFSCHNHDQVMDNL